MGSKARCGECGSVKGIACGYGCSHDENLSPIEAYARVVERLRAELASLPCRQCNDETQTTLPDRFGRKRTIKCSACDGAGDALTAFDKKIRTAYTKNKR